MATLTDTMTLTIPADEPTILVTRFFAAPPELVWEAVTNPEHFAAWWGPRKYRATVLEMDVRPGGKWRVTLGDATGSHPFHGEYLEVTPISRLVLTQCYGDSPPMEVAQTFEAKDGGTLLSAVMRLGSVMGRDMVVKTGMESGMRESYERLDELLARLAG